MNEFLKDDNNKFSSMRIMSLFSLFASFYFSFLTIKLDSEIGLYIVSMFVIGAFAPKVIQKYVELMPKYAPKEEKNGKE